MLKFSVDLKNKRNNKYVNTVNGMTVRAQDVEKTPQAKDANITC